MAQSVTNDALWEKLSEIDKTLNELAKTHKSSTQTLEQVGLKDEIISKIEEYAYKLGKKSDMHSDANKQDAKKLTGDLLMLAEMIACISDRQQVYFESQKEDKETYLNFKFFRVKKTSIVITMLGILIFTLTIFCMKQQDDYSLLTEVCYKQGVTLQKLNEELEAHKEKQQNKQKKK